MPIIRKLRCGTDAIMSAFESYIDVELWNQVIIGLHLGAAIDGEVSTPIGWISGLRAAAEKSIEEALSVAEE